MGSLFPETQKSVVYCQVRTDDCLSRLLCITWNDCENDFERRRKRTIVSYFAEPWEQGLRETSNNSVRIILPAAKNCA